MADAVKKEGPAAGGEAPKKKSRMLLIIIAVVVLGGGGAGAWFMLKPEPANAAATKSHAPKAAPIYYKFDPAFVVNFGGEGSARYLQVTLEAMSRDAMVIEELKNNEPAVRNDLVLLYSSQSADSLLSAEGKEKLRAQTLQIIQRVLNDEGSKGSAVEGVYFTSFVIQ